MKVMDIIKVVHQMGLPWTFFRGNYEFKRRTGLLKRKFPVTLYLDDDAFERSLGPCIDSKESVVNYLRENRGRFLFNSGDLNKYGLYLEQFLVSQDQKRIVEIADNAIDGRVLCFNRWTADYGNPINWHLNAVTGYEWPREQHWVDMEELSFDTGDVKYVWEASRFTHIFYFVRAYALTKDEKYAEGYWKHVEHWLDENPYQLGINWKCGQEVSLRTYAWIFGLFAFLDSPHTNNERIYKLLKSIYYNTIRVENNIDFAIKAVQNNHAISEAACLFTVGILFPFFKDSDRFAEKGLKYLEQEGLKQIYEDGSYIQHSTNYHRLMLQLYTWCLQLGRCNKVSFSVELEFRLLKAVEFLYQMQDEVTGRVPNYGANDGALIFPLSACDYLDYRPQLNTLHYLISGVKLYQSGIHEEDLLWFCGFDAVESGEVVSVKRESKGFDVGGYYVIRGQESFGMVRCARFKHRPGHGDMLHFDLWYKGVNVLADVGSYSYNPEEKYRNYFGATRNHNTITVNDMNQSRRGPRFLTIDWPEGYLEEFVTNKDSVCFSGYHTAYGDFIHNRRIEYKAGHYVIIDTVENRTSQEIKIKLNWNVGTDIVSVEDNKYRLAIGNQETIGLEISSSTLGRTHIHYGDEESPAGWTSLYYGEKLPLNQLVYEVDSHKPKEVLFTILTL